VRSSRFIDVDNTFDVVMAHAADAGGWFWHVLTVIWGN
jgi:hypothetical protein